MQTCIAAAATSSANNNNTANAAAVSLESHAVEDWPLAFSQTVNRQLWVPILEKAYAKVHGSYRAVSGGWISEGLYDLTGCPTNTISFQLHTFDKEMFWCQLQSYRAEEFPMGASCPTSGNGLVGGHAYSVLDVCYLAGVVVGQQRKISDYFRDIIWDFGISSSR